jgi:4-hydroxybenzoate polyprenyltransferase/phosphoserine phosphatase
MVNSAPLAVDLDGTLLSSDLLVESASAHLIRQPLALLQMLGWLADGKDRLKGELASRTDLDASVLPYHPEVLAWLREEHAGGRQLVLASASDQELVSAVSDHLGIFDEAWGTSPGVNLKSEAKRDLLVERFGEGGFDYVGNHADDLAVWDAAAEAHVVGSAALARRAEEVATVGEVFPSARGNQAVALLKAMRPHQWAKNALVAVPLFAAQVIGSPAALMHTLLAVIAFCLAASSVYLLNDIVDVAEDRHHPTKRRRPFASGGLNLLVGWVAWPLLALAAFGLSIAFLPWRFTLVLACYLAITLAYSSWAKRKAVLDVITLGALYTIRIVAGAAAIAAPLTSWLLSFSMLFFLSLALVKRVSELTQLRRREQLLAKGRGYYADDLELLSSYGVASSIGAVVIFSLYINDPATAALYRTPELLGLAIPILLAWLMRCWLWAHRGDMNEDPIVFAVRDPKSILAGAAFVLVFLAANGLHL